MSESRFTEIATSYTDGNGVLHLDGYRSNDIGEVVAYVFNKEVYYTNPANRYDPLVALKVNYLKTEGIVK